VLYRMGESKPEDPENTGKIRLRLPSMHSLLQVQVFSLVSTSGSREVVFVITIVNFRHVEVKVIQN
jgi:hypothetical protein